MGSGTRDSEEKDSSLMCPNIVSLILSIAMVVVGSQYNEEQYCKEGKAPLFLMVGGGVVLTTSCLKILALCTPCDCDDLIVQYIVVPLASIADFVVLIWGSVVVFGAYSTWDYRDPESEFYCDYTPYMFAFVVLILDWVLFPFMICCIFLVFCATFWVGFRSVSRSEETADLS